MCELGRVPSSCIERCPLRVSSVHFHCAYARILFNYIFRPLTGPAEVLFNLPLLFGLHSGGPYTGDRHHSSSGFTRIASCVSLCIYSACASLSPLKYRDGLLLINMRGLAIGAYRRPTVLSGGSTEYVALRQAFRAGGRLSIVSFVMAWV